MKKEIRQQKREQYKKQLTKAIELIVQTPTGKEVYEAAQARGTSYMLDFSLGKDDAGSACEQDDGTVIISSSHSYTTDEMFSALIENLAHETTHASVRSNINFINYRPIDYNYIINLDEANAVAKSIQIAHEMHSMGIDSQMWNYINGDVAGKGRNALEFQYKDAIGMYNILTQEDDKNATNGVAMKAAFLARLTLERKKRDTSTYYDQDDFKHIQEMCSDCLKNEDVQEASNKPLRIEQEYGSFLTNPQTLQEKDVAKFGTWQGSNYLRTENGSFGYLLSDKMKTEGLNGFAKNALTKTNLIVEKTRHQLGFSKETDKSKENIALTQAKMQKGR